MCVVLMIEGISYCDLGTEVNYKLIGLVDSDFGSDHDTRKSMTGYLMSLNGGAISWKSSLETHTYIHTCVCTFKYRECAGSDGRGASMHECVARCVASEIDSLCQSALVEKTTYRSVLAGQES
jgi:hypothetical protein